MIRFHSSEGSSCEATARFDVKPAYGERTLTDAETGISIYGLAIHQYAELTVDSITLHAGVEDAACNSIRERIQKDTDLVFLAKNVSLSYGFQGDLTVTIPCGTLRDGQKLQVLYCSDGKLVTLDETVEQGEIVITTNCYHRLPKSRTNRSGSLLLLSFG